MKLITTAFSVLLLLSCQQNAEIKSKNLEPITSQEALNTLNLWKEGYLKNDIEAVDNIVHASWVYSGSSNGKTSTKLDMLEELKTAGYYYAEIVYDDLNTRIYGNTAIVTGREKMIIVDKKTMDSVSLRLRFTDVYQKMEGEIKALSTHSSPIDE